MLTHCIAQLDDIYAVSPSADIYKERLLTTLSTGQVLQALVSTFLTTLLTRLVLQALFFPQLDYCSVMWSGATQRDLGQIAIGSKQGSTAGP